MATEGTIASAETSNLEAGLISENEKVAKSEAVGVLSVPIATTRRMSFEVVSPECASRYVVFMATYLILVVVSLIIMNSFPFSDGVLIGCVVPCVAVIPSFVFMTFYMETSKEFALPSQMKYAQWESIGYLVILVIFKSIAAAIILSFADLRTIVTALSTDYNAIGQALRAYIEAAFLEETLKYIVVRRFLFRSHVADPRGLIVYGAAAANGFAMVENIEYLMVTYMAVANAPCSIGGDHQKDIKQAVSNVAILRALLAIPLHTCCGVITGALLAHRKFLGKDLRFYHIILIPMMIHGTYDYIAFMSASFSSLVVFVPFLLFLCIFIGFFIARKLSVELSIVPPTNVRSLRAAGLTSAPDCLFCAPCRSCCPGMAVLTPMARSNPIATQGLLSVGTQTPTMASTTAASGFTTPTPSE